ncbi:VCBS repeat-containing protein [uncultured Tateyamaria sp.]|uniref:FG-GAP repeat domain-containing protein n=1 Tax=uncultured Tateyamaria sp. TaxID=455651 RepID=UPI0026258360|nr:VCBS repeat-containing protein [uncultured Tateyamaria sp.]
MLGKLKYIPRVMMALILMMMIAMAAYTINDRRVDYDVDLGDTVVPEFTQVEVPFDQQHADATSLPITGSAAIDIDGDGTEELFIGGGYQQENGVFKFENGSFAEVPDQAGLSKQADGTALGALVIDHNKDSQPDMLVTHPEGIWLYTNTGGTFTAQKLDAEMNDKTTGLSIAVADVNGDGHFDMYISGYIRNELIEGLNIFNKEGYGGTSELFINNGDNSFSNETKARGLQYLHNTFQAAFGDFEGDGDLDLIVAHDTGHVRTYLNDGTGNFTNVANPNSDLPSYPMGIGIADLNNDGLTDYSFSNIGSTPPTFMVRGDLREDQPLHRKWIAFVADGKGGFTDQAEALKIADYEFAWGMSHEDLNLDGREDLIVSQNFVSAPFHKIGWLRLPGRMLVQTASGEMAEIGAMNGVVNRQYSISPLTADFNGDGRPDVVHINIAGKSQAFLSQGDTANGYLKIVLPQDVDSIGAMVEITLEDGTVLHKPYVSGEGLASDSSRVIIAGLGQQQATSVVVRYLGGATETQRGSFRDETLAFENPGL